METENRYKLDLLIEGKFFTVTQLGGGGHREPNDNGFPNSPMHHAFEIIIAASKDLVSISSWIMEGKCKKDGKLLNYDSENGAILVEDYFY